MTRKQANDNVISVHDYLTERVSHQHTLGQAKTETKQHPIDLLKRNTTS